MKAIPPGETLPSGKPRGWTVRIDGEEREVGLVEFESAMHGRVVFGLRPEGFDSWVYYEPGGGGATTLPYAKGPDGQLYIGLLRETRGNMGDKPVLDIIGGFVDPGETHALAEAREREEEAPGLGALTSVALPGVAGSSNRLFWVTDPGQDEGVHAWGLEVSFATLEPAPDDPGSYRFKASGQGAKLAKKPAENVRFLPWKEAVRQTPDELARAAIAQLLTVLLP